MQRPAVNEFSTMLKSSSLIALLSMTTLLVSIPLIDSAVANSEDSVCFLRMRDGRSFDLRKLCGKASPSVTMMQTGFSTTAQSAPSNAAPSVNQTEDESDDETQAPPVSSPVAPTNGQAPKVPQPGIQAVPGTPNPGSATPGGQPIAPASIAPAQTAPSPATVPVQRGATPSAIPARALPPDPNEEVR